MNTHKGNQNWRAKFNSILNEILNDPNANDEITNAVEKKRKLYQKSDPAISFASHFPQDDIAEEEMKLRNALEFVSHGEIKKALDFLKQSD